MDFLISIGITPQKIRVYSIEFFFYFILILFIWSFRGIILYPIIWLYIKINNIFATDPIPQKPPPTNVSLPPRPSKTF